MFFKGFLFSICLYYKVFIFKKYWTKSFPITLFPAVIETFYLNSSPTIGPFQEASSNIDLICKDCHIQSSISTSYL